MSKVETEPFVEIPRLEELFKTKKPVVGMLHIDYLLGTEQYRGIDFLVEKAVKDIEALQDGGIDGILVENWKEDSTKEFVSPETAVSFSIVVYELSKYINVPFGINVLNNDYKIALSVAKLTGAAFVELDVFVDHVKSDFKYSPIASKNPFEIKLNPRDVTDYAKLIGATDIPLFVFIQPKHYIMLEEGKTIEESTTQAIDARASAILITKATGFAPTIELIQKAKSAAGNIPVGIGSGFSAENAKEYLEIADFAVVGTSLKINHETDNPVDVERVKELMKVVRALRT